MTLDPHQLDSEPALLEEIEKATLRMVTQAIYDFRDGASEFFVYEPDAVADIYVAGRNAPSRGEPFRVRISLPRLKGMANWRVQNIELVLEDELSWDE